MKLLCEKFFDELFGKGAPSSNLLDHLKQCEECRKLKDKIESLRKVKTAFPEKPSFEEKERLFRRISLERAAEGPNLGNLHPLAGVGSFLVLLAMIGIFVGYLFKGNTPPNSGNPITEGYSLSINGETPSQVPFSRPYFLPTGKAKITLPDGTTLEVEGPTHLEVKPRGFSLTHGKILANVKPQAISFRGEIPQGEIKVEKGIFRCESRPEGCCVEIVSGDAELLRSGEIPVKVPAGKKIFWKMNNKLSQASGSVEISPSEEP